MRESVTIKKTHKEVWMRRDDDYETAFRKISEKEALESLENARNKGDLFCDCAVSVGYPAIFGYWN